MAVPRAPAFRLPAINRQFRQVRRSPQLASVRTVERRKRGQVAQVVERSPEKAGVGGSTPSLATMFSKVLAEIGRQESGKIAARVSAFIFCESVSPKLGRLVRNMGHLRSIRRDSTSYSAGAWLDRTCTVSGLEKF